MKIQNINNCIKPVFKNSVTNNVTSPLYVQNSENKNQISTGSAYNIKPPQNYTSQGFLELPFNTKAHFYKLSNGQKIVVVPKEGPTIVKTHVNVGAANETEDLRGISHFIEHSLFNGSEGLNPGDFFTYINKIGANTNASTGFSTTNYYIQSNLLHKDDLENKIKIHASMLETPKFSKEMIKKEKGPVSSEINMILDNSDNLAISNSVKNLFNIDTISKVLIAGTVDNINNLTQEKVITYYKNNYFPANMVTVITGNVDPQETIKLVSKYFQSRAKAPNERYQEKLETLDKTVRNDIISPKATKTHIAMSFAGPENNNTKDKVLLDVLQMFLFGTNTARLSNSLKEIKSSANFTSHRMGSKATDKSAIAICSVTSEKNCENVLQTIYNEIANIEKQPPTDNELQTIKKNLKINLAQLFESSNNINSMIGNAMLDNDINFITNYSNIIDNLNSQDIVNFTKKYLDLNKASITVIHQKENNLNKNASIISFGQSEKTSKNKALNLNKIDKYILPNNIELYTNNINKNLSIIDMNFSTKSPKNIKAGVSEIYTIMLNHGSKFKDIKAYYSQLEKKGIKISFSCDETGICSSLTSLPEDAKEAIKATKEVILSPRLTPETFEYAKAVIEENLSNITPSSTEGMISEMYKGQRQANVAKDIKNNLEKISLNDIKNFQSELMKNLEARCVISGPMNNVDYKNTILNELSTDFNKFKKATTDTINSYQEVKEPKVVIQNHEKSQAKIELGYKFKTNDNLKDSVTFILLETILGGTPASRLFSDLREKQNLAYQVNTRIYTFDNSDVVSLYIKTTTDDKSSPKKTYDNLQKAIDGFCHHINKLKNEKVSEDELESAKLNYKNKILTYNEYSSRKNDLIMSGADSQYGISLNNKALEIVDTITTDDIINAANYIFNKQPILSIVATKDTIDNNIDYIKKFGEIVEK